LLDRYERILTMDKDVCSVVQGYRPQKSAFTNAKRHARGSNFLKLDFKDAFNHVTSVRVGELLREYCPEFTEAEISILVELTTWHGVLQQGLPTSPVLFNLACLELDRDLLTLVSGWTWSGTDNELGWNPLRIVYTRYGDDLTFSCSRQPHGGQVWPFDEVFLARAKGIIVRYGFRLAQHKTRALDVRAGCVRVTGYSVGSSLFAQPAPTIQHHNGWFRRYAHVRLSREQISEYRAMLQHALNGERSQEQVNGMLARVREVYRGELPSRLVKPYKRYQAAVAAGKVPKSLSRPE
jgi:hypothetical protein